jgi:hypothetical protein
MTTPEQEPEEPESIGFPDKYEFRLSPDKRLFAIWDPGNTPWFVTDAAGYGKWLSPMDGLGWTRYLPTTTN